MSRKKHIRKVALTTMAASAAVVSIAPVASAAETKEFKDVPKGSSHYEGVQWAVAKGIVKGYEDGTFGVGKNLSRPHTAVMFANALGLEPLPASEVTKYFSDVTEKTPYAGYIAAVAKAGIFSGDANKKFQVNKPLTREQMATVLVKAFKLDEIKGKPTVAIKLDNVDPSHKANVQILADLEITNQVKDFRPGQAVQRGQFATFLKLATEAATSAAKPAVESVSAINATDVRVNLSGNVKDAKIDKDSFVLTVNGEKAAYNFKQSSDYVYDLELTVPLKDGDKVEVTGMNALDGSSASTTYKNATYSKVEAVETTVYDGEAGQQLKAKVDGVEQTASQLAKEGYEVSFQADTAVFADGATGSTTSKTGEIAGNATDLVAGTPFKYKVTISKDNNVLSSAYAKVNVYDKSKTAASAFTNITIASTGINEITSGKVVENEAGLAFDKIEADLKDGRKSVDLLGASGLVEFETSDATIATVASNGAITAKKAGNVTITVKSGDVKKDVNLTVVKDARKINTVSYSGSRVDIIKGKSQDVSLVAKDQYGDTFNTAAIATATNGLDGITEASVGGKNITTGTTINNPTAGDATKGKFTATVTASSSETGTGNITLRNGSKVLVNIPVSVASATTATTNQLKASADTIDLNSKSKQDKITFTLQEYLSGYYNGDVNLSNGGPSASAYKVAVYDTDGKELLAPTAASGADFTVTRADLILESGVAATGTGQADSTVDAAAAADVANFETGNGLIKIFDQDDNLVVSKSFKVTDSAPKINSATFANVDFSTANATNLKLSELLTQVGTTASANDGVLRYEANGTDELLVYYSASATPAAFDYDAGDVALGTVKATAVDGANATLTVTPATPFKAEDVVINSSAVNNDKKVQFNVYQRGGNSVAKTVIKAVK